ncbi:hypothetical protein FQN52_001030 [Onygenales sp. PD_12]|nr:hypothetical protein FQN52_001030 [Onygenales sp. PD_12]
MADAHFQSSLMKRSRSTDSRASGQPASPSIEDGDIKRGKDSMEMPGFLNLSRYEIANKFKELERIEYIRLNGMGDGEGRWVQEKCSEDMVRNRYLNIYPWAHSRIRLRVADGECDYINASSISLKNSGTGEEARYIAAQGPKIEHLDHFWSMVFHESKDVAVIAMLTQTYERTGPKCAQYFPLNFDAPTMYLSRAVTDPFVDRNTNGAATNGAVGKLTLLEYIYDDTTRSEIRRLQLTIGSGSKIVWHFLFAGWTDNLVPEGKDRDALIEMIKLTIEKAGSLDNPRIVHCSAGVGRTGTFITVDHLLRELQGGNLLSPVADEADPVFSTVNLLREQRPHMVYNNVQYQYIYDILRKQALLKLGRNASSPKRSKSPGSRSQKMARFDDEDDTPFEGPHKDELVPIIAIPVPRT